MTALILRLLLDVPFTSVIGATLAGSPEFGERVACIAWRESRNELVGIHKHDAWIASKSHGPGWSTRGVHGQVAAYSWTYVPIWLRWGPWIFDAPLISAFIATRRANSSQCTRIAGCARWKVCER